MSRPLKVAEAIKEQVSDIIQNHLKDPRVGFITITRVELTNDLRYARIYFSVMGDEKKKAESVEGIKSAAGFIRKELGARLGLRYVPEVAFKLDDSITHSLRIAELLNEIKSQEKERRKNDTTENNRDNKEE